MSTSMDNFKLSFRDLLYRVKPRIFSKEKKSKDILKGINGDFNGSELSAIIGLSGSGKSSLLDCLSGFRTKNVSGSIAINDNNFSIRKNSSYIMQEHTLHELLTVYETMMLSMNLKNSKLTSEEKEKKIKETLSKLTFELKSGSFVRDLSGGEQKRLSIAVEIIHDPKILFLDEPTTGLDSVASTNCIHHLKKLASEGRTVIITIHQPSALILKIFDHVYALAEGRCIFQGTSDKIVPFLGDIDLVCPPTYNPADFLLEIANNDYGDFNRLLTEKITNGLNDEYRNSETWLIRKNGIKIANDNEEMCESKYSTKYTWQVYYLMLRTYLITSRDKTLFFMRLLIHLFIGLTFGFIYKDVGNDGGAMFDNYRFLVVSVVFLLYTSYHSHIITFPLEFPIIKREHFNGWYSTRAFYSAFILFELPITIVCCTIYVSITYWMTEQPRELFRFTLYLSFTLGMSLAAHILGIAVTALMNVKFATIFGTFFLMPCVLFSAIMILTKHTHPIFQIFFELNFLDNTLKGVVNSVLGFDREKIPCDEIFCHFGNPKKVIRDFGVGIDITKAYSVIFSYIVVFQIVSFVLIRYRLKNRH